MLQAKNMTKTFEHKHGKVTAVNNATFEIQKGEFLAITGPSGSGKSTVLLALGGMSAPDSGSVEWSGSGIYSWDRKIRAQWRAKKIGFLFQTFNLIPYLTIYENIELALKLSEPEKDTVDAGRINTLIEKMNIAHRTDHLPGELSVGEQQRAAFARALIKDPEVILADEPTGNLDPDNGMQIITMLKDIQHQGKTVVVVTHDLRMAGAAGRVLKIMDGKVGN